MGNTRQGDPAIQSSNHPTLHPEVVSAAGLAPAIPRFQAEHVAATPRAVCPDELRSSRWGHGNRRTANLGSGPAVRIKKLALPVGLAPTLFPQTTGCFSIKLREQNGLPSRSPVEDKARLRTSCFGAAAFAAR